MNYIGINNENEFFTTHYLSEIFANDIKEVVENWNDKSKTDKKWQPPVKALRSLAKDYFQFLDEFNKRKYQPEEKLALARDFYQKLLNCLKYDFSLSAQSFEKGSLQILAEINKENGAPHVWIAEALCFEPMPCLSLQPDRRQFSEPDINIGELNFEELLSSEIFALAEPPRWLILISPYNLVLIDRQKWSQKRFVEIDLNEVFGRREDETIKAFAVLCHSDCLAPVEGESVLDRLDENSHKHAFGVTEDLKYALRESIELLANEAIQYSLARQPDFLQTPDLDARLTREALRYMYRLLFLFFIESRPELDYVPMKSDAYLQGYSIESLRDIELVPLLTENDKNGFFFQESISLLFDMIFHGREDQDFSGIRTSEERAFTIIGLPSHLFNPELTPILNSTRIRNHIWQKIVRLMSLNQPSSGKSARGRISYSNLGINQLGAVYEALLSYKGFIARETLYEVKKKGTNPTPLDNAYFVNEKQLAEYQKDEMVFDKDKKLVSYPPGTFIYRLAGRDREKSASYYTPEVLTKCVVKYALKDLLANKKADEILKLTVCEPAMGSAAFLNEAINQLSEAYLQKKQQELNQRIPHDKYLLELQKVKMHIADNNVFGVDLNPTAVELAEVSLWLNALFTEEDELSKVRSTYIPWFGFQLTTGNSLIGARRQVFHKNLLEEGKSKKLLWLEEKPERLDPQKLVVKTRSKNDYSEKPAKPVQLSFSNNEDDKTPKQKSLFDPGVIEEKVCDRDDEQIYHFLLGDQGMAAYDDKVIKTLRKDQLEKISSWRNSFIKPYKEDEIEVLKRLAKCIDKIWAEHTRHLAEKRQRTTDSLLVWGQTRSRKQKTDLAYKDSVLKNEHLSEEVQNSSLYTRLKLVMDYWCALWFWPIDAADKLPNRSCFFEDISALVEKKDAVITHLDQSRNLFAGTMDDELKQAHLDEFGFIDVNELVLNNPRLQIVKEVAAKNRFLHWELEYADIFADNGGFDLILGNPPWLKVEWHEGGIMGEVNPLFDLRKFSASKLDQLREATLKKYGFLENDYISEYEGAAATKNFLNAYQNYPDLKGMRANLYKCFLPQAWALGNKKANIGFLHPEGTYDDPKGGKFRTQIYPRLKYHFQFVNELLLFAEVDHHTKFSVNAYSAVKSKSIGFDNIANLFGVKTIEICYQHNGHGPVGGIKDDNNQWNLNGHKNRIIKVNSETLKLFAKLYDRPKTPADQARLPALHAIELISVLEKFALYPQKLGDLKNEFFTTVMWNETNAQKDGTIRRDTIFAKRPEELILSGPHFFVGNPTYKTPKRVCELNSDYDILDLTLIPEDYLPRSNYVPDCQKDEYDKRIPNVPWHITNDPESCKTQKVSQYFRVSFREMASQSGERTMIASILPPGCGHIYTCISIVFQDMLRLMNAFCFSISINADFFMKTTGMGHVNSGLLNILPCISNTKPNLLNRALAISCLSPLYSTLWAKSFTRTSDFKPWSKNDKRLDKDFFSNFSVDWKREYTLRTDYERRQALVEIDVLVAMELGMTLDELCAIYRIQFPVLRQNESDTWYDQKGRIVFTVSKGLPGVGLDRTSWEKEKKLAKLVEKDIRVFDHEGKLLDQSSFKTIKELKSGYVERIVEDDTIPDYRKAYCELLQPDGSVLQCPCPDYPEPIEGPVRRIIRYHAPFDKCDREEDYRTAWEFFSKENCEIMN